MESTEIELPTWQKWMTTIVVFIQILVILTYIIYFIVFQIQPELLESTIKFLWLEMLYPNFLFIPLIVWLYFFLYASTYIINIFINKYYLHSPNPSTGLVLPRLFHNIAAVFLNISIFIFCSVCIYVMSSLSWCWLEFIDGETPVGICSLVIFTSSITVTIIPLFIIIPLYFWSIRYLMKKWLFWHQWVKNKSEFLDLQGDDKSVF